MTLFFTVRLAFRRDYGHKIPLPERDRLRPGDQGLREGWRGRLQQERAILQSESGTLRQQRCDAQVIPRTQTAPYLITINSVFPSSTEGSNFRGALTDLRKKRTGCQRVNDNSAFLEIFINDTACRALIYFPVSHWCKSLRVETGYSNERSCCTLWLLRLSCTRCRIQPRFPADSDVHFAFRKDQRYTEYTFSI